MATVEEYRKIVRDVLSELASIPYLNKGIEKGLVFDDTNNRYMLLTIGWENNRRVHGCVIHIDIVGNKIWIQKDNTDLPIARELERAGIPKSHIVLGFHNPDMRQYTEYAIA